MKLMKYLISADYANAKVCVETDDVNIACTEFLNRADNCDHVCLCDGFTGEVLAHTGEEPYCTDEMALILLGFLMQEAWGEEEEEEVVDFGDQLVSAFMAEILALPC